MVKQEGCCRLPDYPYECRLELKGEEWYKITLIVKPSSVMHLDVFNYLSQQIKEQDVDNMLVSSIVLVREK